MKKFDWESFEDYFVAVHCKTEEEAEDFLKQCHERGMTWLSGSSLLDDTSFDCYEEYTCYDFEDWKISFSDEHYYKFNNNNYTILEWSDYMNKKEKVIDLAYIMTNDVAIHCKTEEEAKEFALECVKKGFKWCNGESLVDNLEFNAYKENTCYRLNPFCDREHGENIVKYSGIDYFINHSYEIIDWHKGLICDGVTYDNVIDENTTQDRFTKDMLKTGMIVELRNGKTGIVLLDTANGDIISSTCYMPFDSIYDDLTNVNDNDYDIIKIYQPQTNKSFLPEGKIDLNNKNVKLIWQRQQPKKMTLKEIEKELGYPIEIIK